MVKIMTPSGRRTALLTAGHNCPESIPQMMSAIVLCSVYPVEPECVCLFTTHNIYTNTFYTNKIIKASDP